MTKVRLEAFSDGGRSADGRVGLPEMRRIAALITAGVLLGCARGAPEGGGAIDGNPPVARATAPVLLPDRARSAAGDATRRRPGAFWIVFSSDAGRLGEFVATLLLTDPSGRRTGIDPATGDTLRQIPGAVYGDEVIEDPEEEGSGMASLQLEVMDPVPGSYRLAVRGTARGRYDITIRGYNAALEPSGVEHRSMAIDAGQTHQYQLEYDREVGARVSRLEPAAGFGVAIRLPTGGLCLAMPDAPSPLDTVTLVQPDAPQSVLVAAVEGASSCPALDRATVPGPYYAARPVDRLPEHGQLWLAVAGQVPTRRDPSATVTVQLSQQYRTVQFKSCASREGLHLTAWEGRPLASRRLWHRYYYLGYDVEPTCSAEEVEPSP